EKRPPAHNDGERGQLSRPRAFNMPGGMQQHAWQQPDRVDVPQPCQHGYLPMVIVTSGLPSRLTSRLPSLTVTSTLVKVRSTPFILTLTVTPCLTMIV